MTVAVRPLLAEAAERLRTAGVDSARVDAELLLAALLDRPRSGLLTLDEVTDSVARTYGEWVTRRVSREPLQHITGTAPFRNLVLDVGRGVFVPRPETELLVDAVLPHLRSIQAPAVVDLCAGSGALGLAIADEVPGARVVAVEAAQSAARWLTGNAAGTSVRVLIGDVRDPELLQPLYGRVDAVVSNPPYVPLPTDVAPEVLADPREAVFAGIDGLDLMATVAARAAALLRSGGVFACEHDDTHATSVPALLGRDERWTGIVDHDDLSGRPRYVTARRV